MPLQTLDRITDPVSLPRAESGFRKHFGCNRLIDTVVGEPEFFFACLGHPLLKGDGGDPTAGPHPIGVPETKKMPSVAKPRARA